MRSKWPVSIVACGCCCFVGSSPLAVCEVVVGVVVLHVVVVALLSLLSLGDMQHVDDDDDVGDIVLLSPAVVVEQE